MLEGTRSEGTPVTNTRRVQEARPMVGVPSWQDAYVKYRPLLFSALAKLARQGYPVPPSEASDLVHDFFADSWTGLVDRYDPQQAQFSTYMYGAFLNFSRRRVVKDLAWTRNLRPPDQILEQDQSGSPEDYVDSDKMTLRAALERLPPDARDVLDALTAPGYGERKAAAHLGLKRHRFRTLASQALARLAIEMNVPGVVAQQDFSLIRALWIEGKSIEDASTALGISPLRVRAAQRRVLKTVEKQLSYFHPTDITKRESDSMDLCNLWKQFVETPGDPDLAVRIRERSEDLFAHLEDCEDCDMRTEALGPHLEAVYAALGTVEASAEIDTSFFEEYDRAVADDEVRVTSAMRTTVFERFPSVRHDLSVLGERSPFLFFLAGEAVSMRAHRYAEHDAASSFVLRGDGIHYRRGGTINALIAWKDLEHEVVSLAGVDSSSARLLLEHVLSVARSFPRLMLGLECRPDGADGVRLDVVRRDSSINLYEQWSPALNETYTAIG